MKMKGKKATRKVERKLAPDERDRASYGIRLDAKAASPPKKPVKKGSG